MAPKTLLAVILALFVAASLATLAVKELARDTDAAEKTIADLASPVLPRQVIACYFRGEVRCPTCIKIEEYSKEAVETTFPEAVKDGRLQWHMVNFDEAPNAHFVEDFGLTSASLVLVELRDGRQVAWKNLPEVWTLTNDKPRFIEYVQKEIDSYLNGLKR